MKFSFVPLRANDEKSELVDAALREFVCFGIFVVVFVWFGIVVVIFFVLILLLLFLLFQFFLLLLLFVFVIILTFMMVVVVVVIIIEIPTDVFRFS